VFCVGSRAVVFSLLLFNDIRLVKNDILSCSTFQPNSPLVHRRLYLLGVVLTRWPVEARQLHRQCRRPLVSTLLCCVRIFFLHSLNLFDSFRWTRLVSHDSIERMSEYIFSQVAYKPVETYSTERETDNSWGFSYKIRIFETIELRTKTLITRILVQ